MVIQSCIHVTGELRGGLSFMRLLLGNNDEEPQETKLQFYQTVTRQCNKRPKLSMENS